MIKLSLTDKYKIFDIRSVTDAAIVGEGRTAIVFEYLSVSNKPIFYEIIREKNLDFQVKIVKEEFASVKQELLENEWFDFAPAIERAKEKYAIEINDQYRDPINMKTVSEDELSQYVIDDYIYRHYLIFNVSRDSSVNIEAVIYDVLLAVKETGILIRGLEKGGLMKYLRSVFRYGEKVDDSTSEDRDYADELSIDALDEGKITKIAHAVDGFNGLIWERLTKIAYVFEQSFFHKSISNITTDIVGLFGQSMWKGDNFFRIGNAYNGGVIVKGLPRDNFNILRNIYQFMDAGDWIVINLYPPEKHQISKSKREKAGLDMIYGESKKDETYKEGKDYLQMIVNFSEPSQFLLDDRIQKFQRKIGFDFLTKRIEQSMGRYIETAIGTGISKLYLEGAADSERLKKNLLF